MRLFKLRKKHQRQLHMWSGRPWGTGIGQAPNLKQTWYSLKILSRRIVLNRWLPHLHFTSQLLPFPRNFAKKHKHLALIKEQMHTNFTFTLNEQFKLNLPNYLWNLPWFPLQTETLTMLWAATMSCNITYCCKGEKTVHYLKAQLVLSWMCILPLKVEVMRLFTNILLQQNVTPNILLNAV